MARQLTINANGNHPGDEGFDPANVEQWGIAINNPKNTFQSVLWQFGGEVFDQENALFDSPEAQAALQYIYDLIAVEQVAPPPAGFDANQAFAAGQLAILPQGTWMLNFMNGTDVNWDAWPMVQMGSQSGTRMSSHVLHMPQSLDGEQLEAATRVWSTTSLIMGWLGPDLVRFRRVSRFRNRSIQKLIGLSSSLPRASTNRGAWKYPIL